MPSDTAIPADSGKGGGRLPPLAPEHYTPDQKRVADGITGGPRGGLRGPFPAMLRSPVVAERFQLLGEYLRFNSTIPTALNELAILVTAREWSAQYEWYAHHLLAMKAGLPPAIAQAVAEGRMPAGMDEDQRIVWQFCTEMHQTKQAQRTRDASAAFDPIVGTAGRKERHNSIPDCGIMLRGAYASTAPDIAAQAVVLLEEP